MISSLSNFLCLCGRYISLKFAGRVPLCWNNKMYLLLNYKSATYVAKKNWIFYICFSGRGVPLGWTNNGKKYRLLNYKTGLCWHFSGLWRQRDHFQGFYQSGVKHDRHFCGWLTSSPVALYALSVLGTHPTQPQWILEPHPTANNPIGSLTPQVHFEIKQVEGEIKCLEAGRVAALAPKSLKETAFTALLPRDERVKKATGATELI